MEESTNTVGQELQTMNSVNIDWGHDRDLGTERNIDSVSGQNSSNLDRRNRTEEPKVFNRIAKPAVRLCMVVGLCLLVSSIALGYRSIKTSSRCDGLQDCSLSASERHSVRQLRIATGVLFALGFLLVVAFANIAVNISKRQRRSPQALNSTVTGVGGSDDLPGYEAAVAMDRPRLPESEGPAATENAGTVSDEDLTNPPPSYEEALGFLGLHIAR